MGRSNGAGPCMKHLLTGFFVVAIAGKVLQILPHHRSWPSDDDWVLLIQSNPDKSGNTTTYAVETEHPRAPGERVCISRESYENDFHQYDCEKGWIWQRL